MHHMGSILSTKTDNKLNNKKDNLSILAGPSVDLHSTVLTDLSPLPTEDCLYIV